MKKNVRVIPRLDIKGPNLVKGIHLEGLRVLGRPENYARYYYERGADELIYVDVVASLYNRNSLEEIIRRTAGEIFVPLTVGGGLRSLDDIRNVLRWGADKVSLNTAAIRNPNIIREASRRFGSSTIVVAIEAIRQSNGTYLAYTDNGREHTGTEVVGWARRAEELGAGEILLTSVDREGTGDGYDVPLVKSVSTSVSIPVIAHGGAGRKEHVAEVVRQGHADAVSFSSIVHYQQVREESQAVQTAGEGNTEFLSKKGTYSRIVTASILEIKRHLRACGISVRVGEGETK
jgi:cyclase